MGTMYEAMLLDVIMSAILSLGYETGLFLHRYFHQRVLRQKQLPNSLKTISVGNIAWGGTGKTPLCAWIAERKGRDQTAILSRGYRGGDEAAFLAARGFLVGKGKDRVAAAENLLASTSGEKAIRYWVLDDGLQHWRVRRDVEIVCLDALRPFGVNGKLIPVGSLRERPKEALQRASAVVIHNASLSESIEDVLAQVKTVIRPRNIPVVLSEVAITSESLKVLKHSTFPNKWVLLSALGNNDAFFQMMRRLAKDMQAEIVREIGFQDHYAFSSTELKVLVRSEGDVALLTTAKDAARCPWILQSPWNAYAVEVEWRLLSNALVEGENNDSNQRFLQLIDQL